MIYRGHERAIARCLSLRLGRGSRPWDCGPLLLLRQTLVFLLTIIRQFFPFVRSSSARLMYTLHLSCFGLCGFGGFSGEMQKSAWGKNLRNVDGWAGSQTNLETLKNSQTDLVFNSKVGRFAMENRAFFIPSLKLSNTAGPWFFFLPSTLHVYRLFGFSMESREESH